MFNMLSWLIPSQKNEKPAPLAGAEKSNKGLDVQFVGMSRAVATAVREVNAREASKYLKKMKEKPITNNKSSFIK